MSKKATFFLLSNFLAICFYSSGADIPVVFTENKGQVCDQLNRIRTDVHFMGEAGDNNFFLRRGGFSYQFIRRSKKDTDPILIPGHKQSIINDIGRKVVTKIYRLDIDWIGGDQNAEVIKEGQSVSYTNYYLAACPGGVTNVHSYSAVTYQQLYNGIDVKFYGQQGGLKYDYLVAAGADYRQIKLVVKGATRIFLDKTQNLILLTPFGRIREDAPVVFQNGRKLKATWVIKDNVLSFEIPDADPGSSMVIDPAVRSWGTYYGGTGVECAFACSAAPGGFVYSAGYTDCAVSSVIATAGSHQSTLAGFEDAFLVKYNTAGVRQWATYYGDTSYDCAFSCAADSAGNVFLAGMTSGGVALVTAGCHQSISGGGNSESFLAKFNSAGVRQWGTLYGGPGYDNLYSCATSTAGDVYIAGYTDCSTGTIIASSNGYQPVYGGGAYDAFLVKFSATGVRLWGTYYGGSDVDDAYGCAVDQSGNPYLCGTTSSTTLATSSSHQPVMNGLTDAFIVKFNSAGSRLWCTYYGGSNGDFGRSCSADPAGNIYLTGYTSTNANQVIATLSGHQLTFGGGIYDAFIVKFDASGNRLWGTYYGGLGDDFVYTCDTDPAGNVYMGGTSNTTGNSVIPSPNSHQTINNGSNDGFLVKFDSQGQRIWSTFYGGSSSEMSWQCSTNSPVNVYLCGFTSSAGGTVIATTNGHQQLAGGNMDAFLVQFNDCPPPAPVITTSANNLTICAGQSATLMANGSGTINWYAQSAGGTSLGNGGIFVTPALSAGNHVFYADATTCAPSISRTSVTITAYSSTSVSVAGGTICSGDTFILNPSGAANYSFSSGSATVSPLITTSYTVSGTSTSACFSSVAAVCVVTVLGRPVITVNSGSICAGNAFVLMPSGANSYSFSSGSALVSPVVTTTFAVHGTAANGCVSQTPAIAQIFVTQKPSLMISVSQKTVCAGETVSLSVTGASSYTWNFGVNGDSVLFVPLKSGTISVFGSSPPSCVNSASVSIYADPCSGLMEEQIFHQFRLYPVPTTEVLHIENDLSFMGRFYNAIGELVYEMKGPEKSHVIKVGDWPPGIYILKAEIGRNLYFQKVIIH